MSDTTDPTFTEEEQKSISSLVKEVSAFFHREIKKQKKDSASLGCFKERISKEQ